MKVILIRFFMVVVTFILFITKDGITQNIIEAEIFAEIIPAITATETAQLNFGRFTPTTQGGQVLITAEGSRMATGTVVLTESPHQAARFYVTGEINATFSISLPSSPIIIVNQYNSKTMSVSEWVSIPSLGKGKGILLGGEQQVMVGATLIVGTMEDNPPGIYNGTYNIRFDYN